MAPLVNPYIAGAPVTEARLFFGRDDVFQWIENSLAGQYTDHILVIHGQRRVGKTSVLKQLGNRLPRHYIPVFFDLQGRTHTSLDRFLWWLAREIVRVLKQERGLELTLGAQDEFARDPDYFENLFLPALRTAIGSDTLLLTFDEFDNLEEGDVKEELARPLIDHLRRLMGTPGLTFIFSIGSSGRRLENMQAAYTEFFKTALYKKISFLTEEQVRGLVTRPVEGVLEYAPAAVDRIYQVAGGHPYFTQLTCHEVFARCQQTEERHIGERDVDTVLYDVVERGTVNLKFVWDEASDIEKWALAALASLERTDSRSLADYLRRERVRFSDADLTTGLLHLREKDVLTAENRFVIHLLRLWLQKNRPIEQVREELTEVNPIANRYIEIGLEFRDAGLYDKAIESFREALEVARDNVQAQVNIGLTYMDQKTYDRAIIEFERALAMDDEDVAARAGLCEAQLALGDVAMQKGRLRDAVQSYQRVLAINAEHTEARQRMAQMAKQRGEKALQDGRDEDALGAFAEALKFTPEEPALIARVEQITREKRAKVLAALIARSEKEAGAGNWERALAALHEALEISPDDESLLAMVAALNDRQLKQRCEALLLQADQAEQQTRWDTAIAALNEYLSMRPDDAGIRGRLAQLIEAKHSAWLGAVLSRAERAAASQKWNEAFSALNEVLSLEPGNEQVQGRMAEFRAAEKTARLQSSLRQSEQAAQAGRWDDALAALNDALTSDPENAQIQAKLAEAREARRADRLKAVLHLADTAAQAGKWDAGIAALKETLAVEPENTELQRKLAELLKRQRDSQLALLRSQARSAARAEKFAEALRAWEQYLALQPEDAETARGEMETVRTAQGLAASYADAQQAFTNRHYDRAIDLLKQVIQQDTGYKDASRLLAEAIELRRTARQWWQSKWLQGAVIGVLALVIAGWAVRGAVSPLSSLLGPAGATSLPPMMTEGSTLPATQMDTLAALPRLTATSPPAPTATPMPLKWTRLSSGQVLLRDTITAIAADPSDPGVIYAAAENAGIYKSIDGGLSWGPAYRGLANTQVRSLLIDPDEPRVLYAGTMDGTYKTEDRGESWRRVGDGAYLLMDLQDGGHLYARDENGIFETSDSGNHWETVYVLKQECPDTISSWAIHPANGRMLFLAGGETCGGVYQSMEGGRTWTLIGMRDKPNLRPLLVQPNEDGGFSVYTWFVSAAASEPGTYVSTDGGAVWTNLGDDMRCSVAASAPEVSGKLYCAGDSIWVLQTGEDEWQRLPGTQSMVRSALYVDHTNGADRIMAGGTDVSHQAAPYVGIYISDDGGVSWNRRDSGLGAARADLRMDAAVRQALYLAADYLEVGASLACELYKSVDDGTSWLPIHARGEWCGPTFDAQDVLYLKERGALQKSWDGGETWQWDVRNVQDVRGTYVAEFAKYSLPSSASAGSQSVSANPYLEGAVYDVSDVIYYSDDAGVSWQLAEGSGGLWDARLFYAEQGKTVYAIGRYHQSFSTDAGKTWRSCGESITSSRSDSRLALDEQRARLYLATPGQGVMVSEDGCKSWEKSNTGLSDLFVNSLAVAPRDADTVYAGTDGGAYVSFNGGETWGQVNEGLLGATVVYSIAVDKDSNVYAATPYGIFKLEGK